MSDEVLYPYYGKALRMLRSSADLTQAKIAEVIGVTPAIVSRIEHGKRALRVHEVDAVLKLAGTTYEHFQQLVALARSQDSFEIVRETDITNAEAVTG